MMWWQKLVAACISLTAVMATAGLVGKWGLRMWSTNRKFNRLLDQLLGDETARPPIPSLMDKLTAVQDEQARQADALAEHVRWHGDPGGRPATAGIGGQRTYQSSNATANHAEGDGPTARHRKVFP